MKKLSIILLALIAISITGCDNSSKIQNGDIVTISYTGTLIDGEIFEKDTKTITIGSGDIIKGIEKSLINKKLDQRYKIKVIPSEGYGYLNLSNNQKKISKNTLQKIGLPTEKNKTFIIDGKTGTITNLIQDEQLNTIVIFDINPLETRQETTYNIHIEKIEKAQTNKPEYNL